MKLEVRGGNALTPKFEIEFSSDKKIVCVCVRERRAKYVEIEDS